MVLYRFGMRGEPMYVSDIPSIPFDSVESVPSFHIFSSSVLSFDEEDEAVKEAGRMAEDAAFRWIQDKRYTLRLFASSAIFLLVYLFLSVAVPDPVPVVDEILFSALAAAVCWILLSRADRSSALMRSRLELLQSEIEHPHPVISDDMGRLEELYTSLYEHKLLELAGMIVSDALPPADIEDREWFRSFFPVYRAYVEKNFPHFIKEYGRMSSRAGREKAGEKELCRLRKHLVHLAAGGFDLVSYAFFMILSSSAAE